MTRGSPTLAEFVDRLQRIADSVHAQALAIAEELERPRRMNQDRITAAQHAITQEIHGFRWFLPEFNTAYHAVAETTPLEAGSRRLVPPDWLAFSAEVGHLRNGFNNWNAIRDLIAEQCPPRRRPLVTPAARIGRSLTAAMKAGDLLFDRLHGVLNPYDQSPQAADYGCFRDIGLAQSEFMEQALAAWRILQAQGRRKGIQCIDVGCGGGLKVLSALEFFDRSAGLEFDPAYVRAARELFERAGAENADVIEGDALAFDSYDQFDVVYFHRPMQEAEMLWKLEERITSTVPPGTVLIAPYDFFVPRAEGLGCAQVCDRVYLAQASPREATALRREAELIGCNFRPPEQPLRTIWDPILKASRRQGF